MLEMSHAMSTFFKYIFDTFGALVLPTFSTCFLVEHQFEIDVRAFACFLFFFK